VPRNAFLVGVVAVVSVALVSAVAAGLFAESGDVARVFAGALVFCLVALLALRFFSTGAVRRGEEAVRTLAVADEKLAAGNHAAAEKLARDVLSRSVDPVTRATTLMTLAACAEQRAAFDEQESLLNQAEEALPPAEPLTLVQDEAMRAVIAVKRAFARAAQGRLDAAETDLRKTRTSEDPLVQSLGARAQALVLARRGEKAALNKHLEAWTFDRDAAMGTRSKALLGLLARHARMEEPGYRAPAMSVELEPGLREWVVRAWPEGATLLA
jgi:hypothetical protein